jgi:hypothetical protein
MALKKHCDVCELPFPEGAPAFHTIILQKAAEGKPERKMHLALVHRKDQSHDTADVCPKCTIGSLESVIKDLKAVAKPAAAK